MLHCKNYEVQITGLSNRPREIKPEEIVEKFQKVQNSIVCLITVESGDILEINAQNLFKEIIKFSKETGHEKIVLLPFAHLSNKLTTSKEGIKFFDLLEHLLQDTNLEVIRSHFGSDKSLLLNLIGHKGNARYREF